MPKFPKDDDDDEEEHGSFITILVDKNKEKDISYHHQNLLPQSPSTTSQILPLVSSPINKKLMLN